VGAHEFRNRFGSYMERAAGGSEFLIRRHGRPYARLGPPNLNLAASGADD
jgi:prevent-host-death family protein